MTDVTVGALAELVGGRLVGLGDGRIVGLADLRNAQPNQIGFVRHPRYYEMAAGTEAGALLALEEFPTKAALIVVDMSTLLTQRLPCGFTRCRSRRNTASIRLRRCIPRRN